MKLGIFTSQSYSDGKEMCEKSVMHVQSCYFANQTNCCFLTSVSLDLKVLLVMSVQCCSVKNIEFRPSVLLFK